ncbi:response regulator [Nitrospira sp. Kam-Ns4a]
MHTNPGEQERTSRIGEPARETILLAEDERPVRELIAQVLRAAGYVVLCASDGKAALELCRSHPGPIHLLLSDMAMPGMTGDELAVRARALRPELRLLLMSGFVSSARLHADPFLRTVPFIHKPFSMETLRSKVRDALTQPGAS